MITMALRAFFVVASLGLAPNLASAQNDDDRAEVASVTDSITKDFFDKDMESFAKLWAEDAVFITVDGIKADGKDAIVDMHSMADYIIDDSTSVTLEPPIVTFLAPDLALAYSVWGGLVFKFGEMKTPVTSGYLTVVLRKTQGSWKILSATNASGTRIPEPFKLQTYTPELWTTWGVPRPDGLPLSKDDASLP